ncbi:MAG: sigma-54-dependent Fis family transcriptional regulator [Candidatus Saganbacteria bacterium]|nr:sigma-54-dependent Fis family transcriptional regulator [Candidatus Saganbacteria bacterium]
MPNILLIDDESSIRESFNLILADNYQLYFAASGEAALKILTDQQIDLAYLDIRMPGMDGLETLKRLKQIDPSLEVIMVTAVNDVQKASEAIRHGARDYVVKPFDVDHILKLTEQTLRKRNLLGESRAVQRKLMAAEDELIGQSEKITQLRKLILSVTPDQRVLICGETGTEKYLVARMIHKRISPESGPFLIYDLAPSQSPAAIKAALFGWSKGSSSVALEAQAGLLERSESGSLFINNLELLLPDVFAVIKSGRFFRQGSNSDIPINSRLIGGCQPGLEEKDREVFDHFSQIAIDLPPLRERPSDIGLLADHFMAGNNRRFGLKKHLSAKAKEQLANYSWPGNVKQLENVLLRLCLSVAEDEIDAGVLPFDLLLDKPGAGSCLVEDFDKTYIGVVCKECGQDTQRAAAWLGLTPLLLETKL